MRSFKRAIPFLLLNIILSAATTLAVLNWWGGGFRLAAPTPSPTLEAVLSPTQAPPSPTLPPATSQAAAGEKLIEIQDVQGAGDLNNEMITLHRLGEGDLRLTGWKLEDNAGHHFTFPEFILNTGGAVQVFTHTGQNNAIALYWGLPEPVWAAGKTIYLYDAQDNLQASLLVK